MNPLPSFFLSALLASASLATTPAPGTAPAPSIQGALTERALMKTVQLVYVEKATDPAATLPTEGAQMGQKNNVFLPHVLPVVAGTKVNFLTSDPELHNIYAKTGDKVMFNTAMVPGAPAHTTFFADPGVVALTCNIHSEMSAFVVVLQNKYFALPDAKTGTWHIDGVPPGAYKVRIWGEKLDPALAAKVFDVTVPATGAATLDIATHPAG